MTLKPIIKVIDEKGEIKILNELPEEEQYEIRKGIALRLLEVYMRKERLKGLPIIG